MATVVAVFVVTSPGSSTSAATCVLAASVVSGVISEIDPPTVVLPTAKPPAMMILTGIGTPDVVVGFEAGASERLKAIEHPFEKLDIGPVIGPGGRGLAGLEQALAGHV